MTKHDLGYLAEKAEECKNHLRAKRTRQGYPADGLRDVEIIQWYLANAYHEGERNGRR